MQLHRLFVHKDGDMAILGVTVFMPFGVLWFAAAKFAVHDILLANLVWNC
jgi:hypothetical protein